MSPMAASTLAATIELTPPIVISRLTFGLSRAHCASSLSRSGARRRFGAPGGVDDENDLGRAVLDQSLQEFDEHWIRELAGEHHERHRASVGDGRGHVG